MKKLVTLTLLICAINSANLKDIITSTQKQNGFIKAKEFELLAKQKDISKVKSSYLPTVDIFANITLNSPKTLTTPGRVTNLGVLLNAKLYDGGKRANEIKAIRLQSRAKGFELKALQRSLSLKAINLYYSYFKALANKDALIARKKALIGQINRVKKLINANLATNVELDRLKAALAQNNFAISSVNLAIKSAKENLQILSHKRFKTLKYNHFLEPKHITFSPNEDILKIKANAKALTYSKEAINSIKKPQVALSYTYSKNRFANTIDSPFGSLPNHTSKLNLKASLRVFDGGVTSNMSESIKYQRLALLSKANELTREQKRDFKLAKLKLKSIKSSIKSAKAALNASNSAYLNIKKQYAAGLVDYISYLDALTQVTVAKASYKEALYDYEIAKAYLYYYAGKNLKGYIRWKR